MSIGNVTEQMLQLLNQKYTLREQSAGEFALLKVKGMDFTIKRFVAEGLGNVSLMEAKGFFGLMKMDTLIINPTEKDLPLFSYDRVLAAGNDTLIIELYDTLLGKSDLSSLQTVKENFKAFPDHDLGSHWYDNIKLAESVSKKGKKAQTEAFSKLTLDYLEAYLACDGAACDAAAKRQKGSVYVEGLLSNGGPSTDIFKKALGEEKTAYLFRKILFGTGEM